METLYCYCCRVHHPADQMYRFSTRHGFRWRCRRTIEAARRVVSERDAFGSEQTKINRATAQQISNQSYIARHQRSGTL